MGPVNAGSGVLAGIEPAAHADPEVVREDIRIARFMLQMLARRKASDRVSTQRSMTVAEARRHMAESIRTAERWLAEQGGKR